MKNKKLAIFMLIFGILFIIVGIILLVCQEVKSNKNKQKEMELTILETHDDFRKKVDSFNELRSSYYSEVVSDLYVETVKDNYKDWVLILDKYTEKVDSIEETSTYLKENCVNKYFSNKDVMNKCEAFVIAYETVINYYTKDLIEFNEVLELYRTQNKVDLEKTDIKDYVSKYNYMDVNSDGKFIGKD